MYCKKSSTRFCTTIACNFRPASCNTNAVSAFHLFSFNFSITIVLSLQFFPIIERELRVAAHQARTWWRRYVTLNLALAVVVIAYFTTRRWSGSSQIGNTVFDVLVVCGFIFSLLAGPLSTTDCLSRERREGTLGLLFLTNLRSRDVVFGKMAVSSFDSVLI